MAERVNDRGVTASVVLVDLALHESTPTTCLLQHSVGVWHMQHQANRNSLRCRRFQSELGCLVGEIQHPGADRDLGVADAAVGYHDRIAKQHSIQRFGVPGDGRPRIGNSQIRQGSGTRLGDRVGGSAHHNSFGSWGQGEGRFQPRTQPRCECRIGLDQKIVAMQHGQRIDGVVPAHRGPPWG